LRAVGRGAVGSQGYGKMVVLRNGYKCCWCINVEEV
jgi:hypothetical protein